MKHINRILELVERLHLFLARTLTRAIGKAWAWQSRFALQTRFAVGFALLSLLMAAAALVVSGGWLKLGMTLDEPLVRYLETAGHLAYGVRLAWAAAIAAVLCVLAAGCAFLRRGFAFRLMQVAWSASFAVGFCAIRWTITAPDIINLADHKAFDSVMRNEMWTNSVVLGGFALIIPAILLVALLASAARRHYGLPGRTFGGDPGGSLIANLRTGGRDPRWRSSLYWAISIFLAAVLLPYLMFCWGWEDPYGLPQGSGEMVKQQVVQVKKEKKKKKKLTVNPFSPYILERMDIDDVKTLNELEVESRDTYVATANQGLGKGGKGNGGWPQGMANSAIRFIRLKYRGGDWDQDMGRGADYNLLIKFHEWTGMKIARETEFREIERLKFFPKKKSPPFVFMTGMGGISLSDKEVKILRDYCLVEGGMLFIDNGGGHFDSSVRNILRRIFPGKPLVDIPNDDSIYQRPYVFPDGAPPFWHHAGYRALGVRDEGRWVVFYHPGDINDAWKDDHSGATAEVADQAYKLGVNVMFYAFNQYYHRHYEQ